MAHNPNRSDLDQPQIIQNVYEEANDQLRVKIQGVDPAVVIPVVQGGLNVLGSFRIPFSSISNSVPFVITAGLAGTTQQILIADTTGQVDRLMWSTTTLYTNPGCERQVNATIPPATAVSIQSDEASNPVAGDFIISFLGI